jgi:hypothetical protein
MKKNKIHYRIFITIILLVILGLSACRLPSRPKFISVITSHQDGQSVVLNEETRIVSITQSSEGIDYVQLFVNGQLIHQAYPSAGFPTEFTADQPWIPTQEGNAIISIIATDAKGTVSDPVSITLNVVPAVSQTDSTPSPTPTNTPEGLPQTQTAQMGCTNDALFISHITFPINTYVMAGSNFTKVWQVNNSGTCDWINYQLVLSSGQILGAISPQAIPTVSSASNANITLNMVAPTAPGTYSSTWRLSTGDGTQFGPELPLTIIVPELPTNTPTSTATFTLTPTLTPTLTITPSPTLTPTVTPTITETAETLSIETNYEQVMIAPGNSGHTTVNCPSGTVAVSGGFAAQTGIRIFHSMKDGNGWRVYGRNLASANQQMTIYAVCLTTSSGSSSQPFEQVNIAANDRTNLSVDCPTDSIVTGGGWVIGSDTGVDIYNSSRDGNGWQIWVNNTQSNTPLVNVYAICLSGVSGSTSQIMSSGTIDALDSGYVKKECPSGSLSTGGGFAIQLGPVIYNTSYRDNGWINYALNQTGDDKTMYTYAICLSP